VARLSFIVCALLALGATPPGQSDAPEKLPAAWHGIDGQSLGTGTLSNVTVGTVQIQKLDNSTADLKLESLSLADRVFALTQKDRGSEFQKPIRQWTSASGTYHVNAKVLSATDTSARLLKADGKIADVPLDKISKEDRAYIERVQRAGKLPEKEPDPFTSREETFGSVESFSGKPTLTTDSPTQKPVSSAGSKSTTTRARTTPTATPNSESVDRNPYGETPTGSTATGIPTYTGPRGGTYHYSKSGNKVYSKKK
jgi:SLA1 homology domain 1, SHD1